jgi:hypothetical protein
MYAVTYNPPPVPISYKLQLFIAGFLIGICFLIITAVMTINYFNSIVEDQELSVPIQRPTSIQSALQDSDLKTI